MKSQVWLDFDRAEIPEARDTRLLSCAEVQAIFPVTDRTLRRWEARKILVPIRAGRTLFYHWDDIKRLIVGGKTAPEPALSGRESLDEDATKVSAHQVSSPLNRGHIVEE